MERLTRRNILGAASAVAGGSALAAVAASASTAALPMAAAVRAVGPGSTGTLRELITEFEVHKEAFEIASHAADQALAAIYPDIEDRLFVRIKDGDHLDLPPEVQRLNAERQRLYELMDAAYDRVAKAPCETMEDVIAKLEWSEMTPEDIVEEIIPAIRRLTGGAA